MKTLLISSIAILLSACGHTNYKRYTPGDPCYEAVRCEITAGQLRMTDPSAQGTQPGSGAERLYVRDAKGNRIATIGRW